MEAILFIAGIAGAVWAAILLLRGGLVAGSLLVLLAGTCFSVPFLKIDLGPAPLTIDRLLLMFLVIQYVFWRRFGWADPKPIQKTDYLFFAFIAMLIISTFSADWQTHNYQPVAWLIVNYLMPAVMFWIARQTKWTETAVMMVFASAAVFGVYLSFTALAEYLELSQFVFPKYIITSSQIAGAEFVGRGRGPLLHPIGNGLLLSVCFACLLMWWPRLPRPGRIIFLAIFALYITAFYCSLTRSVWMGAVALLAMIVWPVIPRHWRWPLGITTALLGIIVIAAMWQNLLGFKRDKELSAQQTAESVELRPILATIAWKMFLDRPLFGCGYAQYTYEHVNYVSDRSTQLVLERGRGYIQHNVLLSLLTETGLVGVILFLATIGNWFRLAWQRSRNQLELYWIRQTALLFLIALVVYLINGMFHDVSCVPMANMTLFFSAGMVSGLPSQQVSARHVSA